jgi:hypothetical protein
MVTPAGWRFLLNRREEIAGILWTGQTHPDYIENIERTSLSHDLHHLHFAAEHGLFAHGRRAFSSRREREREERERERERERWTLSGFLKTELLRKEVNDNN